MIENSAVFNEQFTGFYLYDLDNKKEITEINGDKYFTPASNTKLFTFYAGLKLLKDSIAGVHYIFKGDSLIFWGTGDPTFLDPDYKDQKVLSFLRNSGKNLYWSSGNYTGEFYGNGWSYDDYNEYYQPEISELPVFSNVVRFRENNGELESVPELSSEDPFKLSKDLSSEGNFRVYREILNNRFHSPLKNISRGFQQKVPFKTNPLSVSFLLAKNLPNYCGEIKYTMPENVKSLYSIPADTLYKNLMLPSDNFIAEQILLNIAATNGLEMNAPTVIKHVIDNYLKDLPDRPVWADGSGMSRMNMFTPRSIAKLCEKIYNEVGDEKRLFELIPQGGKTGTIKNLYKSREPFLFAKTGSLNFTSALSGYLVTESGRKVIFSFMNNNYVRPSSEIRTEMEKVLTFIHKEY